MSVLRIVWRVICLPVKAWNRLFGGATAQLAEEARVNRRDARMNYRLIGGGRSRV